MPIRVIISVRLYVRSLASWADKRAHMQARLESQDLSLPISADRQINRMVALKPTRTLTLVPVWDFARSIVSILVECSP